MARQWTRASVDTIGFLDSTFDGYTGALTFAALINKHTDSQVQAIISIHNATPAVRMGLRISAGNLVEIFTSSGSGASTTTVQIADSWCLIVGTRAAGTSTPRLHIYKYGTNTWTHENAGGTVADGLSAATATLRLGTSTTSGNAYDGDMEVAGVWKRALTDAEVENLAFSLQQWYAAAPDWLVKLDQSATGQKVVDLTGKGGNESAISGTSIATSSPPVFNYGAGPTQGFTNVATATSLSVGPAVATWTGVTPDVEAGDVTLEAGPAVATWTGVAPSAGSDPPAMVEAGPAAATWTAVQPSALPNVADAFGITLEVLMGAPTVGDSRGSAVPTVGRWGIFVDWENNGNFSGTYDDVTCYVRAWETERGRDPTNLVKSPLSAGRFSASLLNTDGLFSPDNAASPLSGYLKPNRRMLVVMNDGSSDWYVWTGWTEEPAPGKVRGQAALCQLVGYGSFEKLQAQKIFPGASQNGEDGTDLIDFVLTLASWPPELQSISGYILMSAEWNELASMTVLDALKRIQDSDPLAWFYEGLDWGIVHEGPNDRQTNSRSVNSQATFTDDATDVGDLRFYAVIQRLNMKQNIYNQIVMYLPPASEGAAPVPFTVDDPTSQADYGIRTYEFDQKLFPFSVYSLMVGTNFLQRFKDPIPGVVIEIPSERDSDHLTTALSLRISDRITLTADAVTKLGLVDHAFHIEKIQHRWSIGDKIRTTLHCSGVFGGSLYGRSGAGLRTPFTVEHSGLADDAADLRYQETSVWLPTTEHVLDPLLFTSEPGASEFASMSGGNTIYTNIVAISRLDTSAVGSDVEDSILHIEIYGALRGDSSTKALNIYVADHFTWPPGVAGDAYLTSIPGTMTLVGQITDWWLASDPDVANAIPYEFDLAPSLVNTAGDTLLYITFEDTPAPSPPSSNLHLAGIAMGARLSISGTSIPS